MTNPTPEQLALNVLVQAARAARLTYEDHSAVERATQTLLKLVTPPQASDNGEVSVVKAPKTAVSRH